MFSMIPQLTGALATCMLIALLSTTLEFDSQDGCSARIIDLNWLPAPRRLVNRLENDHISMALNPVRLDGFFLLNRGRELVHLNRKLVHDLKAFFYPPSAHFPREPALLLKRKRRRQRQPAFCSLNIE